MTSLTRAVTLGGLGFGLGFLVAGALGDLMLAGFLVGAAIGGAALAFATGAREHLARLALAGAIGGGVGFFIGFFIVIAVWDPGWSDALIGLVGGGVTGLALGGAGLRSARAAGVLAATGGVAFALAFWLVLNVLWPTPTAESCCTMAQTLVLAARMGLVGLIGGVALGAATRAVTQPAD